MSLSALIRKRGNATATVATPATHEGAKAGTVANVASVAVANQLFPEEEVPIRAWLAHIKETDPATIADVLAKCATNPDARAYCLEQARQVPPPQEPDCAATCGACRHFQRIDHLALGHCAQGEPEAPSGLWDADPRYCEQYQSIKIGNE